MDWMWIDGRRVWWDSVFARLPRRRYSPETAALTSRRRKRILSLGVCMNPPDLAMFGGIRPVTGASQRPHPALRSDRGWIAGPFSGAMARTPLRHLPRISGVRADSRQSERAGFCMDVGPGMRPTLVQGASVTHRCATRWASAVTSVAQLERQPRRGGRFGAGRAARRPYSQEPGG
jgi:hypothetical protein